MFQTIDRASFPTFPSIIILARKIDDFQFIIRWTDLCLRAGVVVVLVLLVVVVLLFLFCSPQGNNMFAEVASTISQGKQPKSKSNNICTFVPEAIQ